MSHYAGLPSRLRVGPYDVAIEIMPPAWADAEKAYGEYHEHELRLRLADNVPSAMFALVTALHEILHAVYETAHLRRGDDEERMVSVLAAGLGAALRDNPQLITWMGEKLDTDRGIGSAA